MLGVVKRARWPADPEEAKAGGFVVSTTSDGTPVYRNPCAEPLQALLPNLLALIRTQNSLFLPENVNRLSKTFARVYDDMDMEENSVLGISQPVLDSYDSPVYRNIVERGFFTAIYRNCYQVLGNAGPCLQQDFYAIEGLAEQIVGSAFIHLDSVPDHRLRPLVRLFMKQLVMSCPHEYYDSLLCPLLGPLFTYLQQRLSFRWQIINQRTNLCAQQENEAYEENHVFQEMGEEQLLQLVTREVIDLLSVTCVTRKCPKLSVNKEDADVGVMLRFACSSEVF